MSLVPESVRCDTCGEIRPADEQGPWIEITPPGEAFIQEDYCSWRCLAVRCEQQLVPRQPLPYSTIGVMKRRTALEEELLEQMTK